MESFTKDNLEEKEKKYREKRQQNRHNKFLQNINYSLISCFRKKESAVNDFFVILEYTEKIEELKDVYQNIYNALLNITLQYSIKLSIEVQYHMLNKNDEMFMISKESDKLIIHEYNIDKQLLMMLQKLDTSITESDYEESGLSFLGFTKLLLHVVPFVISGGGTFVELPKHIRESQACVNIKNKDNKCFWWSVVAHLHLLSHKESNPSKLYIYKKSSVLLRLSNKSITYPTPLNQINNFESENNLIINVYKLNENISEDDNNKTYPISLIYPESARSLSSEQLGCVQINLLLFKKHYVLIKNLNKLFSHTVKGKNSAFVCSLCGYNIFTRKAALENHYVKCKHAFEKQKYELSDKKLIKFKNFHHQFFAPFVIYADFESYFKRSTKNNSDCTTYEKEHVPLGFAFKTICKSDSKHNSSLIHYLGCDADVVFIDYLIKEVNRIESILKTVIPIRKTVKTSKLSLNKTCFICNQVFLEDDIIADDHDHLTGEYRGPTHSICNLLFTKTNKNVAVIFHNLEGYDLHLFIDELAKRSHSLSVIPKSKEKYLAVTIKFPKSTLTVKFIDSLHFITGSLASNASKLTKFVYADPKLTQKQFYPYSFLTSIDTLLTDYTSLFSNKDIWYNDLTSTHISDDDFNHAKKVFTDYKCKNLYDYTLVYLSTDVLLLVDIFENFRDISFKTYNLDPLHYYTTPGLAWDAALKKTNISLQVLEDREMVDFFIEKGTLKGGISTVSSKKYAKANNPYLPGYNSKKENSYIMYFDVTNLYGYSMSYPLPTGNFKWLEISSAYSPAPSLDYLKSLCCFSKAGQNLNGLSISIGYIFEVDLIYPTSLKDKHSELPLAPVHFNNKLSPNLFSKYNYRTCLENLIFYIEQGLILSKVHKILTFDQSNWLQSYIDLNTQLRKKSVDESEKNFYKLMNNAVYGKTMENVFNRKDYRFIKADNLTKALKLTKSPLFKKSYLITQNLTIIEMNKAEIIFDKPIYIGFAILEKSKLHMYNLHYNHFKHKYGDNSKLMYMDTDSLVYEIFTEDIYKDLILSENIFDMSVYNKEFHAYSANNKGVLGTLKDEYPQGISEFVCLKSKCYAIKLSEQEESKKCKGVLTSQVKKFTFDLFYSYLISSTTLKVAQTTFRSINHKIYTINLIKDALNNSDDKRINLDLFNTVPHGYFKENDLI